MNTRKTLTDTIGILLGMILLVGCGGSGQDKVVTIKVSSATMQEISTWDNNIVFFTSAKNPISSLSEVSVSEGEIGTWGVDINQVGRFLKTTGQDLIGLKMIGDVGEETKLFTDNPKLRLFITLDDFEKYILDTGGGVKVIFEEE